MANVEYTALGREASKHLNRLITQLEIAQSGLVVATVALRSQRADNDPDIANVLEHHVSRRLWEQIDHVRVLKGYLQDFILVVPHAARDTQQSAPMQ